MFKAIIFDFDGVILDSEPLHYQACDIVLKKLGIALPYEKYLQRYVGLSDLEMFPLVLADHHYSINEIEMSKLIQEKIIEYLNIISTTKDLTVIDGLVDFINAFSQLVPKIGICSGSTREEITVALDNLNQGSLRKYFPTIIAAEDVLTGKPSPEGYLKTADLLGVAPSSCLVIEDTGKGIAAAKNANMKVIALPTTEKRNTLACADFIACSYQEAQEWLFAQLYNHHAAHL